jgi:hypothetical protein
MERVEIPTKRIADILPAVAPDASTLLIEGRLQWLTTKQRWKFFETKPEANSPYGFPKPSSLNDPRAREVIRFCEGNGRQTGWVRWNKVAMRLAEGWTIVYDDDGKYFCIADRLEDLVLIAKPF